MSIKDSYLNPTTSTDMSKVNATGAALLAVAFVLGVMGIAILAGPYPGPVGELRAPSPQELARSLVVHDAQPEAGWALVAESAVILVFAGLVLGGSFNAGWLGLFLALAGLLTVMHHGAGTSSGYGVLGGALLWLGVGLSSLFQVNRRVARREQANPLTSYYHELVPVLVEVMGADGDIERREVAKLTRLCDSMNISPYEQKRLIERTISEPSGQWAERARRYLDLAREFGLPMPERTAVVAALAVANADGELAVLEANRVHELGRVLDLPREEIASLVAQHEAINLEMTPRLARAVLRVKESATAREVRGAYDRLEQELEREDYSHLGGGVTEVVEQRRRAAQRAVLELSGEEIEPPVSELDDDDEGDLDEAAA